MPEIVVDSTSPHAQDLLCTSMAWMDRFWDENAGLLWNMGDAPDPENFVPPGIHMVRNSLWYALGLLMRNQPGDHARAIRIIETVLAYQLDDPSKPYHGTFLRAPEEPPPGPDAQEWRHYDPNWREFMMTTFALILTEYEDHLPVTLVRDIDVAMRKAVEGTLARPLSASYTNIALMKAFMLWYAGQRLGEPVWIEEGHSLAQEIYNLFKRHDAFDEYNSPTYYGPDMYALVLWRRYSTSPLLRQMGAEMERLLWLDIARFYHAGLRNLCGPFTRSYGMDMRHYMAIVGQWIWLVTGRSLAPVPDLHARFAHAHDLCFAPLISFLGTCVPEEAIPHLLAFQGERMIERVLCSSPLRVATAWLSPHIMIGGEFNSRSRRGNPQFHPVTVHWRISDDKIGWIRLYHDEPVDCKASIGQLEIQGTGPLTFQIYAPGVLAEDISAGTWDLPNLHVMVKTNAVLTDAKVSGECLEVHYRARAGELLGLTLEIGR